MGYALLLAWRNIAASRVMHSAMLQRLMRAPIAFFDTTPLGRVVNRFSQDMDMLDQEICSNIEVW
jgi:ABC-type multidrug transport system fused ATPase/permease subunit